MKALTFDPSTPEAEAGESEFNSLVYKQERERERERQTDRQRQRQRQRQRDKQNSNKGGRHIDRLCWGSWQICSLLLL